MSATPAKTIGNAHFYAHPQSLVETSEIGPHTRIWAFAHVMRGARIGAHCNIGDHVFIESDAVVGNNVTVKNGVAIWGLVTIKDNVFLGPNCVFTNDPSPRAYIKKPMSQLSPTLVRENSTIGANATVLCGITVGRGAFVGAGTVVIRSVPDHALVVGNPARQIGWICLCAQELQLPDSASLRINCSHCARSFLRTPSGLSEEHFANSGKDTVR